MTGSTHKKAKGSQPAADLAPSHGDLEDGVLAHSGPPPSTVTPEPPSPSIMEPLTVVAQDFHALSLQLSGVEQRMALRDGNVANEVNALLNGALPPLQRLQTLEDGLAHLTRQVQTVIEVVNSIAGNLANTDNRIDNVRAQLSGIDSRIGLAQGWIENVGQTFANSHEELASVGGKIANTDNRIEGLTQVTTSIRDDIAALSGHFANADNRMTGITTAAIAIRADVAALGGHISNTDNRLANSLSHVSRIDERISGLQGALDTVDNRLANTSALVASAVNSLATLAASVAALGDARNDATKEAMSLLLARGTAALTRRATEIRADTAPTVAAPLAVPSLKQQMAAMKKAAPLNFSAWHNAYEVGVTEGRRAVEGNLSHDGHVGATYFRMFLNIHARGRLLDIGCGPLPLPTYLADWPLEHLAGIDPQEPFDVPHPFPFAVSFAETIPWPDAVFETVVIGTSLDHVYLLDQAMAEVKRVLVPGGRLLIWTALMPETPPYDPYAKKISQPDPYHLFHPGRNWFFKLFEADYRLIERIATVASAEFLAFERK